jgi:hypothetical protein
MGNTSTRRKLIGRDVFDMKFTLAIYKDTRQQQRQYHSL